MFLDPINVILELNDPNERMYSLKEERRVSDKSDDWNHNTCGL